MLKKMSTEEDRAEGSSVRGGLCCLFVPFAFWSVILMFEVWPVVTLGACGLCPALLTRDVGGLSNLDASFYCFHLNFSTNNQNLGFY